MEKVIKKRQSRLVTIPLWSEGHLQALKPEMCLIDPKVNDPYLLNKISDKTKRLCDSDPIEFFDPYEQCWFDGTMVYDEDMRDIKNYFDYLEALDPVHGSGIPSYITIRHIDNVVGYGVYANRDIEKGEFIGFYTGQWRLDERCGSEYLFEAIDDSNIFIDANTCGNFTRYINHAYSRKCNLEAIIYLKEQGSLHLPIVIYYAKKKINLGQQLLINYGKQYWNNIGFKPDQALN